MMEREIARPMPIPCGLVVKKGSKIPSCRRWCITSMSDDRADVGHGLERPIGGFMRDEVPGCR
jgi:hypothetical protein